MAKKKEVEVKVEVKPEVKEEVVRTKFGVPVSSKFKLPKRAI